MASYRNSGVILIFNEKIMLKISLLLFSLLMKFASASGEVTPNFISYDYEDNIDNQIGDEQILTTENSLLENNHGENSTSSVEKPFLLSQSVRPIHYKLEIIPLLFSVEDERSPYYNVTKFNAPGKVWIQFVCFEKTSNITLHAYKDMTVKDEKIQITHGENNEIIPITNVTRDNDTDFLVLHLLNPIGGDNEHQYAFTVFIEFIARIGDDRLNGIYLDYYIDPDSKEKRYLSTSLFAPNHARKAFPCFDEPGFKANFSISIGRKNDSGYSSISNMPLSRTKPIPELNGWVWDEFERTPFSLPTYLVALITTDFAFREIQDGDLQLKLHAPEYLIKRTKALNAPLEDMNKNATGNPYLLQDPLRFIASLLKMWQTTKLGRYPLPKVDIIALPHFYFSAMENMGAITFKYPIILNVENVTTTSELLRLSFVAGHEIVHQWFGNMLTPKSWTYVWLKESFSDLFSRIFLSETVYNNYNHDDFVNNELQIAMRFDGGAQTHPLENYVKTASAVGDIYTDIPYRKGASIMNMARNFLSHSVFREGLETLFLEKKYSNIDQYDLFHHLEKAQEKHNILKSQGLVDNITVTDILNSWTKQSGYPVVRMRKEGSTVLLRQEKFKNGLLASLKNDSAEGNSTVSENNGYWYIPVPLYKSGERHYSIQWLLPNDEETAIPLGGFSSITNVEGYFRILYGKEELHAILKGLKRQQLSGTFSAYTERQNDFLQAVDRSQLLDDYFTFAFSKYEQVPVSLLFHIVSVMLPFEKNLVVWNTFLQNIQKPYRLFQNTKYFPALKKYLLKLLQPIGGLIDSQKSTMFSTPCFHSSVLAKQMYFSDFSSKLFSSVCALDSVSCGEVARSNVRAFMETEDISTIATDNQEAIYCAAVKYALSQDELDNFWEFFQKMYFQEYYSVQRDRYLKALSCANNRDYILRLLNWTTNETLDFHDVDRVTLLKNVIANPAGRELVLNFLDVNFDALYKSASVANPVTEALKALVEYVNTEDKFKQLNAFINKHMDVMEKKKSFLEKQIKNAKLNVLWMETFARDINQSVQFHLQNTFVSQPKCVHESVPNLNEFISKITDWS